MNAFCDLAQSAWAVIDGVHRGDHGEENLRRADITRRFVAADMLFAGLEREPVTGAAGRIVGNADEPAGHVAFVGVAGGEVGRVRPAKSERNAEALGAADGDIRAEFAGWLQQRERENVRRDHEERTGAVCGFGERFVIVNRAVGRGILDERPENRFVEFELRKISHDHFDAERLRARLNDFDRLRVAIVGHEKSCSTPDRGVAERHRFGGGGGFIEERRVRDIERGQIGDHRLEIQERFEPALRDFGLIGRVSGIPTGILEDVPLDHRWRDGIGIARADERTRDDIFLRETAQLGERVALRGRAG